MNLLLSFSSKHNIELGDPVVVPFTILHHFDRVALPARSSHFRRSLPMENLSIEAIIAVSEDIKENLQRQANQGILRNDLNRSLVALGSMHAVNDFVYCLKMRAGA